MSRVLDKQLAHQIDQRDAAGDLHPLIAVRGKQHVAGAQRHALRDRYRFLAQGANVERNFAGALIALHAIVVQAGEQHVPQPHLQVRRIEMRMPGTHAAPASSSTRTRSIDKDPMSRARALTSGRGTAPAGDSCT